MPVVSKIVRQKNNPKRLSLFIDDEFYCGIDEGILLDYKLTNGVELTKEQLNEIFYKSELHKLYLRAIDYLSRRPRSKKEVADYLRKKIASYKLSLTNQSVSDIEIINPIIEKLELLGFVNDIEFSRWWIDQRLNASKPKGKIVIGKELSQRGISSLLFNTTWETLAPPESDALQELVVKLSKKYNVADRKERQKLIQTLLRRGFRWEAIQTVLK
ncbi:hypothetical protein HGA91_01090 [candidate division WWE3 bacterium]|nr:hypothetical protein [candidate division WWE3 bacterium]